jgi:hypothetical protein
MRVAFDNLQILAAVKRCRSGIAPGRVHLLVSLLRVRSVTGLLTVRRFAATQHVLRVLCSLHAVGRVPSFSASVRHACCLSASHENCPHLVWSSPVVPKTALKNLEHLRSRPGDVPTNSATSTIERNLAVRIAYRGAERCDYFPMQLVPMEPAVSFLPRSATLDDAIDSPGSALRGWGRGVVPLPAEFEDCWHGQYLYLSESIVRM